MRDRLEPIPVIVPSWTYWRAYRDRYLRKEGVVSVSYNQVDLDGKRYFGVLEDEPIRLAGLNLQHAIIYCCYPKERFMEVLYSRFRQSEPNIKEIWD